MTKARSYRREKAAKHKRETAMARNELRGASEARVFPSSPTAMAIKARDPAEIAMIEAFLIKKGRA